MPAGVFLSTLSLRRATRWRFAACCPDRLFYPRSPCGERRAGPKTCAPPMTFSIHALLAESDLARTAPFMPLRAFLSTLSLRRATGTAPTWRRKSPFLSTLSLRRATLWEYMEQSSAEIFYPRSPCGERHKTAKLIINVRFFYPRSPCGERRPRQIIIVVINIFYPRSPCGERPFLPDLSMAAVCFSIHALLAESDWKCPRSGATCWIFYPRSPCGERQ